MEKSKKYAEVAVLKETFASATSAVVIEFKGLCLLYTSPSPRD